MKITDTELAEYYDISPRTLADWKQTRGKRYTALKWSYIVTKHYRQIEEAKTVLSLMQIDDEKVAAARRMKIIK